MTAARLTAATPSSIAAAARILRGGGLVAFPTETVYGLGADANQGTAVAKIYAAKNRPTFNPLIVHVAGTEWVDDIAMADDRFRALSKRFWPGPLTMILPRAAHGPVSELVSAGLETIALRAPNHDVAQALLQAVGRPLAAPSANRSGTVSPTRAEHVIASFGDKIEMVLDGGPCRVGIESTVIDLTGPTATILRPGSVTADEIAQVIGAPVNMVSESTSTPHSPGQLASHYAPSLSMRLNAETAKPGEALLGFGAATGVALNLSPGGDPVEAAANLFAMLRALDDPARYQSIAVMPIPESGIGIAINDRLRRAASPRQ